jgi:hypothetical protein
MGPCVVCSCHDQRIRCWDTDTASHSHGKPDSHADPDHQRNEYPDANMVPDPGAEHSEDFMEALILLLALLPSLASALPPVTSGLVLNLDSTLGVTKDGSDNVSAWADQSGSGNGCWMVTAGYQPKWETNKWNGRPWIRSVSGDMLTSTATLMALAGARSIFIAQEPFANNTEIVWSFANQFSGGCHTIALMDARVYGATAQCDQDPLASIGSSGSAVQVHGYTWTGTGGADQIKRYQNKTEKSSSATPTAFGADPGYVVWNWRADHPWPFNKGIVEIVVYNRVLSQAERESVVDYLLDHTPATVSTPPDFSPFIRNLITPFLGTREF